MKREILDAPFHHSFSDFLKKGETIIWEGQPSRVTHMGYKDDDEYSQANKLISFFVIWLLALMLDAENVSRVILLLFGVTTLAFIISRRKRKDKNNFEYAISQRQVLFKMKENWKGQDVVYSIPFAAIRNIIIVMAFDVEKWEEEYSPEYNEYPEQYIQDGIEKIGTIFIVAHEPQSIKFDTLDLMNNEKRHQPTLELLEDVEAVAKIIRAGIKNANL